MNLADASGLKFNSIDAAAIFNTPNSVGIWNPHSLTFSGRSSYNKNLIKNNTGILSLANTGMFSGNHVINGGVLNLITGGESGASLCGDVTVNNGELWSYFINSFGSSRYTNFYVKNLYLNNSTFRNIVAFKSSSPPIYNQDTDFYLSGSSILTKAQLPMTGNRLIFIKASNNPSNLITSGSSNILLINGETTLTLNVESGNVQNSGDLNCYSLDGSSCFSVGTIPYSYSLIKTGKGSVNFYSPCSTVNNFLNEGTIRLFTGDNIAGCLKGVVSINNGAILESLAGKSIGYYNNTTRSQLVTGMYLNSGYFIHNPPSIYDAIGQQTTYFINNHSKVYSPNGAFIDFNKGSIRTDSTGYFYAPIRFTGSLGAFPAVNLSLYATTANSHLIISGIIQSTINSGNANIDCLSKEGSGRVEFLSRNTYGSNSLFSGNIVTGYTIINQGTLRLRQIYEPDETKRAKISGVDFTPASVTVSFTGVGTPLSGGETFKMFNTSTVMTSPFTISLLNIGGSPTASYNTGNSTLTINTI